MKLLLFFFCKWLHTCTTWLGTLYTYVIIHVLFIYLFIIYLLCIYYLLLFNKRWITCYYYYFIILFVNDNKIIKIRSYSTMIIIFFFCKWLHTCTRCLGTLHLYVMITYMYKVSGHVAPVCNHLQKTTIIR